MEDTFKNGDYVLISRYLANKEINKNDIVLIKHDLFENIIIKRVIAIGGDTVLISDGEIFINDELLIEPYAKGITSENMHLFVEEGSIFVLGDNRKNSTDSRRLGLIKLNNIEAKMIKF